MKKINKFLISSSILSVGIIPLAVVSCSNNSSFSNNFIESTTLYDELWNVNKFYDANVEGEEVPFFHKWTIQQLEDKINDLIRKDSKIGEMMKLFAFISLKNAISSPYDKQGNKVSIISEQLKTFDSELNTLMKPDDDKKENKTYKNFNNFINKINDFKIEILPFGTTKEKVSIDKKEIISNVIGSGITSDENQITFKSFEKLNFKFSFKINDDTINEKIIDKNSDGKKSIFYRTSLDVEQRKIIRDFSKNKDVQPHIINQFTYEGTKMFYNIETKRFESIVLTTNIKKNGNRSTKPSGFIENYDTKRKLFWFDWKQVSPKKYQYYLVMNTSDNNYFNQNLSTDWSNFLKWKKIVNSENKIDLVGFNLGNNIVYDFKEDEEEAS